jgi:hypothetical protein
MTPRYLMVGLAPSYSIGCGGCRALMLEYDRGSALAALGTDSVVLVTPTLTGRAPPKNPQARAGLEQGVTSRGT